MGRNRVMTGLLWFCIAAATVSWTVAGDSVGYRGINTSGHFEGRGLLKKWPGCHGPELLWKTFVGTGFAGPLIKDGRVYVIGGNPARLYVLTLDGELLQTVPMGPSGWKRFSGSRSTPLKYGSVVVGQMPNANIYAVDLETEETKWVLNAWRGIGSGKGGMGWGVPESPMQHKNLYICSPCSRDEETPGIVALDGSTGKIVWGLPGRKKTKEDPNARWSGTDISGALFTHNGRALVGYTTWCYLVCVDAETGTSLWEIRKPDGQSRLTPVYNNGYLLWEPTGRLQMLKLNEDGSDYQVLWTAAAAPPDYSHGLIADGRVYVFGSSAYTVEAGPCSKEENAARVMQSPARGARGSFGLLCLDAETGKKIHFQPIQASRSGHWWAADGMVYAWWLAGRGSKMKPVVALIQPTREGFEIASMFSPELDADSLGVAEVDWQINTCPSICEGRLFLRYGSLYVYDLRIEQPAYGWRVEGLGLTENTSPPIRWSRTDNLLWTCALPGKALSAPAVQKGIVYVMTDKGLASVQNGSVAWTASLPGGRAANGAPEPTPVVREGKVYAAGNGGVLACFDARGKRQWKTDVTPNPSNRQVGSPVLIEDLVVVQGKHLEAHRVKDGAVAWSVPVPDKKALTMPTRWRLADGVVLFTSWGAAVRASDGKVLAEGLPELATGSPVAGGEAVYFCGSKTPGKPSAAAAYRLPDKAGDALNLEELWARGLDVVVDGTPLVDEGFVYFLDTEHTLHVLDASNGKPVYERLLVPEHEKEKTNRPGGDLIKAGGKVYAVNLGSRDRTVIIEPGRNFRKVWEYAVMEPCPGNPAFEMERQYICAGSAMYGIGGRTPVEPTSPEVMTVAPDTSLDGAADVPLARFVNDEAPKEWIVLGPFKPRTLATDFLAGIGGATNAVLKMGQDIKYRTKTYSTRDLGAHEWFTNKTFTAGVEAIDVSKIIGRKWHATEYFFTVLEFDSPRCVQFRLLTPGGNIWNPKSRLEALAWLAGTPIEDGTMVKVAKGRYPLMLQVAVGTCESWGVIWMAPRFADVTGRIVDREAEYERAVARWPVYQASLKELFVLGAPPREKQASRPQGPGIKESAK